MPYSPAHEELVDFLISPYFEAAESGEIVLINKAMRNLAGDVCGRQIDAVFAAQFEPSIKSLCRDVIATNRPQVIGVTILTSETTETFQLDLGFVKFSGRDESVKLRGKLKILEDDDFLEARTALRRQAEELAILNHLSEVISSSLELDDILHSICREMMQMFSGRNVGIALLNEQMDGLKVVAFYTDQPGESDVTGLEFSLEGNDASLFVIKTGEPIVVPDAQSNPITRSIHQVMRERGTSCLMVIPLLARGEVIGTIGIPSNSQEIFSQDDVKLAMTIASQVASVIDNARLHQSVKRARDAAERELEIGRQIQTSFFPEAIPEISGWRIGAYFRSARQVAGDFYDVFALQETRKLGIVLADVCDKGVGAALFMVLFRSLLRANLLHGFKKVQNQGSDPGKILLEAVAATNDYVATNHASANMFATVFAAVIEKDSDSLWYLNCGHDAPVIIRGSGEFERLTPDNSAIGMFADLTFRARRIEMHVGDSLLAFTDGVIDARSLDDRTFGEAKLLQVFKDRRSLHSRLGTLERALSRHIGDADQFDDITCIGLERTG